MELNGPEGLAIDKSDILYIAVGNDYSQIHRLDLKTGLMTVVQTQVPTLGISGIQTDSSGNVIAAIPAQCRVVRINVDDGSVRGVVGVKQDSTPSCASGGNSGPALNAFLEPDFLSQDTAGNLFIVDTPHARVWRVDIRSGIIVAIAGPAQLKNPSAAAISTRQKILIAQVGGGPRFHTILSLDPTGLLTPLKMAAFAGSKDIWAKASRRRRVFSDRLGNFYMSDEARVFCIDMLRHFVSLVAGTTTGFSGDGGPATKAQLYWPSNVVVDSADNIYISDSENRRVRRIDAKTHIITTVAGNGLPRHTPGTIELGSARSNSSERVASAHSPTPRADYLHD